VFVHHFAMPQEAVVVANKVWIKESSLQAGKAHGRIEKQLRPYFVGLQKELRLHAKPYQHRVLHDGSEDELVVEQKMTSTSEADPKKRGSIWLHLTLCCFAPEEARAEVGRSRRGRRTAGGGAGDGRREEAHAKVGKAGGAGADRSW
jgi:hypothetical protein